MINTPQKTIDIVCDFLNVSHYQINSSKNEQINQSNFSRTKTVIDYYIPIAKGLTKRYQHLFKTGKIKPKASTIKKNSTNSIKKKIKSYITY